MNETLTLERPSIAVAEELPAQPVSEALPLPIEAKTCPVDNKECTSSPSQCCGMGGVMLTGSNITIG